MVKHLQKGNHGLPF